MAFIVELAKVLRGTHMGVPVLRTTLNNGVQVTTFFLGFVERQETKNTDMLLSGW